MKMFYPNCFLIKSSAVLGLFWKGAISLFCQRGRYRKVFIFMILLGCVKPELDTDQEKSLWVAGRSWLSTQQQFPTFSGQLTVSQWPGEPGRCQLLEAYGLLEPASISAPNRPHHRMQRFYISLHAEWFIRFWYWHSTAYLPSFYCCLQPESKEAVKVTETKLV